MYHTPEGILGTIRNVTPDLTLKQHSPGKKIWLFRDTHMLVRDDDFAFVVTMDGVSVLPFLKKAHLLSSNYTYNRVKIKIQLKLICMTS